MAKKIDLLELRQSRKLWANVNLDFLPSALRTKYMNRKKAVDLYIDGVSLQTIADQTGISSSETIRMTKRCALLNEDGIPNGYTVLIPNKQMQATKGKMKQLFLEHPILESFVLGNYYGDKKYTLEHNMNVRTLHTKFVEECRRLGLQEYEYPFTTKDNGYNALHKYIKQKNLELQNTAIKRESKEAQQKFISTGYGESFSINPLAPYNVVQMDGHKVDLLYTVDVENEQGEIIRMPATRLWIIVLIDVSTRVIIGYSISPYENYNQHDVLQAIYNSIAPHKKIEFTHQSLKYPENGGFPSLAIPETEWAVFDEIMLDNAKAHLAQNVMYKLTDHLKCAVNFGSVATPETRGIVERFFKTLETGGFHRLPGTTGSNPRDLKRCKPEGDSIKYGITYEDICELTEYLIAEYNNSAHSALENQTPLQVMERRIKNAGMFPYTIPASERQNVEKLTYFTVERTLRGGYQTGTKPRVSYLGVKYHAYNTVIAMDYIGQKVLLEVNPADVSHVDLYSKDGVFLANLVATGEWGRYSHSLKTHKAALERKSKNAEENTVFTPHLFNLEEELRENSKASRRNRTQAAIVKRELDKQSEKTSDMPVQLSPKHTSKDPAYSREEMQLIDSMSIEEAYRKGLI